MRKIQLLTITTALLLITGCTPGNDGSQRHRSPKIPYPASDAQVTTTSASPSLIVEQEILNCTDDPKCHTEEINEPFTGSASQYFINSIIFPDSDMMSGANVQTAPAIIFEVKDLDITTISNTMMKYEKKDLLGNTQVQTAETAISGDNGRYNVPIHSSFLGSSILLSSPHDRNILHIRICTSEGKNHDFEIVFFLSSNTVNPVTLERDPQIIESPYYKMNEDLQSFLIDSINMENTLPLPVSISGEINISNTTIGVLRETSRQQGKTFISDTSLYPYDTYNWFTTPVYNYSSASAAPTYTVKIERNGTEEEIVVSSSYNGMESVLGYSELLLEGNQKIKMNVYANLVINNSVLGNHGQQNFFEGRSLCSTLTINSSCACFYAPVNINSDSLSAMVFYNAASAALVTIQNNYYPNCGANVPNATLTQQLYIVNHPASSISLIGRIHRSDLKYTVTTWLNGYEDQDDLGTLAVTMDTLEAVKGNTNLGLVDPSLSYQGYIPGQI